MSTKFPSFYVNKLLLVFTFFRERCMRRQRPCDKAYASAQDTKRTDFVTKFQEAYHSSTWPPHTEHQSEKSAPIYSLGRDTVCLDICAMKEKAQNVLLCYKLPDRLDATVQLAVTIIIVLSVQKTRMNISRQSNIKSQR